MILVETIGVRIIPIFAGIDAKAAEAGKLAASAFSRSFVTSLKAGLSAGLTTSFAGADVKAAEAGRIAGAAFSRSFSTSVKTGAAAGTTAAFAGNDAKAGAAGKAAGAAYARSFAATAREGTAAAGFVRPNVAAAEAAGAAEGRARAVAYQAASASSLAGSPIITRGSKVAKEVAAKEGGEAGRLYGTAFGKSSTVAIAGVVVGAASVKLAGDFQQDTNVLVTAAKESVANLPIVRQGIKDTAKETGTAIDLVTEATYDAEKAGYRGAKANEVVRVSAQAAREENAKLSTVVSGVTTVMNQYGGRAINTANALKTGAATAKASFETYTAGLGSFISRAEAAKISLPDVLGVYSRVTQSGVPVRQAAQNVGATIQGLAGATRGAQATALGNLGIDPTDIVTKLGDGPGGRGLAGTLNYLSDTILQKMGPAGTVLYKTFNQSKTAAAAAAAEYKALSPEAQQIADDFNNQTIGVGKATKSFKALGGQAGELGLEYLTTQKKANGFTDALRRGGPAVQTYNNAIRGVTGTQAGVTTALAVANTQYDKTKANIASIADSYAHAGKNVEGWESTQKLFNVQFDRFKESVKVAAIDVGSKLLPYLTRFFDFFANHPDFAKTAVEGLLLLGGAAVLGAIGNAISGLGRLSGAVRNVGRASTLAAGEARAANLGGAVTPVGRAGAVARAGAAGAPLLIGGAGAGAVGAAESGAARYLLPAATGGAAARIAQSGAVAGASRILIPIGLLLVGIDAAKSVPNVVKDLKKGNIGGAVEKELNTQFGKLTTFGFGPALGRVINGDLSGAAKKLTSTPGYKLLQTGLSKIGIGSKDPGKPLTGSFAPETQTKFAADDAKQRYDSAQTQLDQLIAAGRGESPLAKQLKEELPQLKSTAESTGKVAGAALQKAYFEALNVQKVKDIFGSDDDKKPKRSFLDSVLDPKGERTNANTAAGAERNIKPAKEETGFFSPNNLAKLRDAQLATAGTTTDVKALTDQYKLSSRAARDLADSNYDYTQRLGGLKNQLSDTNKTLRGGSQDAQDNRLAISGAALAVEQHARAVRSSTGSQQAGNEVFRAGIKTIQDQATALGYTGAEVNKYVAEVLGIPESKLTQILNTSTTAQEQVNAYLHALNDIAVSKSTTIIADTGAASAALGGVLGAIGGIQSKSVTIDVITRFTQIGSAAAAFGAIGGAAARGGLIGRALGGLIGLAGGGGVLRGPGTGTSDSIIGIGSDGIPTARVSNGEYVVNEKSTRRFLPLLEIINKLGLAAGGVVSAKLDGLPGFASGGKLTDEQKQQQKDISNYLKALAKEAAAIAKLGTQGVIKEFQKLLKAGTDQIDEAREQGRGKRQVAVATRLTAAEGRAYALGTAVVKDKIVTPDELRRVKAANAEVTKLTAQLKTLNTVNQATKDKLTDAVGLNRDFFTSVRDNLKGSSPLLDLSANGDTALTSGQLSAGLQAKLSRIRQFGTKLTRLRQKGVSAAVIREIAADGIESGSVLADEILSGSAKDLLAINSAYQAITDTSASVARTTTLQTESKIGVNLEKGDLVKIQNAYFNDKIDADALATAIEFKIRSGG